MPVDRHGSDRRSVGGDHRDPTTSGTFDRPTMGQIDVIPVRAYDFVGAPVQDEGLHAVIHRADDRHRTVVAGYVDASSVEADDHVLRVRTGGIGGDDVMQLTDYFDRISEQDVDVIPVRACRDFACGAAKRNRLDDGINGPQVRAGWALQ